MKITALKERLKILFFIAILIIPPTIVIIITSINSSITVLLWGLLLGILYYYRSKFYPIEIRGGLKILQDLKHEFNNSEFETIKALVEENIIKNKKYFSENVKKGKNPKEFILLGIVNYAGDLLESGKYHIYRGALDSFGHDILKIYNLALKKLVEINAISKEETEIAKSNIMARIKEMG